MLSEVKELFLLSSSELLFRYDATANAHETDDVDFVVC